MNAKQFFLLVFLLSPDFSQASWVSQEEVLRGNFEGAPMAPATVKTVDPAAVAGISATVPASMAAVPPASSVRPAVAPYRRRSWQDKWFSSWNRGMGVGALLGVLAGTWGGLAIAMAASAAGWGVLAGFGIFLISGAFLGPLLTEYVIDPIIRATR